MNVSLAEFVWRRAGHCCEYCRMPQSYDELPFEIDHVVAEQHRGTTVASNLALACFADNHHKGPTSQASIPRLVSVPGSSILAAIDGPVTSAGKGRSWSAAPPS